MSMELQEYWKDPCRVASLPYWKQKNLTLPPHMKVVHEADFDPAMLEGYEEERYFRLLHRLENRAPTAVEGFALRTAREEDLSTIVDIIDRSYDYLTVDLAQMEGYRRTPVFEESLWLLAIDRATGEAVGCGIADFDPEAAEGILEWVQVLPAYRRRGIGKMLVTGLLSRMPDARFATVSGKADDPTCPEFLYRACGFVGDDVWHILTGQ